MTVLFGEFDAFNDKLSGEPWLSQVARLAWFLEVKRPAKPGESATMEVTDAGAAIRLFVRDEVGIVRRIDVDPTTLERT